MDFVQIKTVDRHNLGLVASQNSGTVVVAEWLRRLTRNLLGPARVGSNPADNADVTFAISYGYSEMCDFIYFIYALSTVVVAEWLRRQTRNLLGPARVGSNPADNADITFAIAYGYSEKCDFIYFIYALSTVVVAEWLRRQTRNLLGPARVGSNRADNADITFAISYGYSEMCHFNYFIYALSTVFVAEWLRRQTRNLLGSVRIGSNPADNADITFAILYGYSEMYHFNYFIYALGTVVVAEWLRRQTRNLLGPARVGSNPADNADITFAISYGYSEMCHFNYFIYALSTVVVAEWLRRQTQNLLSSARVGSNPADNADITFAISYGYSEMCHFNYFIYALSTVFVAEWLRRQTRNLLGSVRIGSNPADNADITFAILYGYSEMYHFNYFIYALGTVVVAEWLRRQTRNLLGAARLDLKVRRRFRKHRHGGIYLVIREKCDFIYLHCTLSTVVVAEWLRRLTRNLLGPARVGSNPADNADVTFAISYGYSEMCDFIYFIYALSTVVVAEWLRRQTRNLLGPARVGSNPADNADITFAIAYGYSEKCDFIYFIYALSTVVVAEWLRRQTRNLLGPARVGSNRADNADITFAISYGYSEMCHFNYFIYALSTVFVAEWLRRQTRNLLGSVRIGSNPADNADITFAILYGYSEMYHFNYFIYALGTVVVAEWLRRQTRNLLGPARVGSNPADNADITFAISYGYSEMCHFNYFIYALSTVVVAEWLRRQTQNLLSSARVGSNPADNADITFAISYGYCICIFIWI
ncbi:unnamed protein product [Clavelina lepadiformis]|uniref:G protein-coupled receptor n=1 Tax=Clavelina lepadiformis TaxID=159417 RepID=A0ABP0GMM9_CLALP